MRNWNHDVVLKPGSSEFLLAMLAVVVFYRDYSPEFHLTSLCFRSLGSGDWAGRPGTCRDSALFAEVLYFEATLDGFIFFSYIVLVTPWNFPSNAFWGSYSPWLFRHTQRCVWFAIRVVACVCLWNVVRVFDHKILKIQPSFLCFPLAMVLQLLCASKCQFSLMFQ